MTAPNEEREPSVDPGEGRPPEGAGEGVRGDRSGHAGMRRAGPLMVVLFVLIPPVAGSVLASLLLAEPGRVPWVLVGAFLAGVGFFLAATPLGRRSDGFRVASYRRLTEAAVLMGLTAGAVVVYTLVVHIFLGVQNPWAANLLCGLIGGC